MKILIPAYTGLGNFIQKLPLINILTTHYPDAELHIYTEYSDYSFFVSSSYNVKFYCIPKSRQSIFTWFSTLFSNSYDIIILPFDSTPSPLYWVSFLFLRSRCVLHANLYHFNLRSLIVYLLCFIIPNRLIVPLIRSRLEHDLNIDLAQSLFQKPLDYSSIPCISRTTESRSHIKLTTPYIVIQPSARNGLPTPKVWSPQGFLELIEKISLHYPDLTICLVGDHGDRNVLPASLFDLKSVVDLLGKTSLSDLAYVLSNAQVVICHDSGIMHLSTYSKTKTIDLYGPTYISRTLPKSNYIYPIISRNESTCMMYDSAISETELASLYPDYYCMSSISSENVLTLLHSLM